MRQPVFPSGCDDRPRDPYDQLRWARKELEVAREAHERVIIAGHVPPGNKVGSNNFCSQHLLDLEDSLVKKIWETNQVCVWCFLCLLRVFLLFRGGKMFTSSKSLTTSRPKGLKRYLPWVYQQKWPFQGCSFLNHAWSFCLRPTMVLGNR